MTERNHHITEQSKMHYDLTRILKSLPGSRGEKLILIHGCFHSRVFRGKDYRVWARSCRRAGFRGEINGFSWESFDYGALLEDFAEGLADVVRKGLRSATDLAERAIKGSRERWRDSKEKAMAAGEELSVRITSLRDPGKVILMGHSLGCRAIKACLEVRSERGMPLTVEIRQVEVIA